MSIFRRQTPEGQNREDNPETEEEYTETVHPASLRRETRQARGFLPQGRLPKTN